MVKNYFHVLVASLSSFKNWAEVIFAKLFKQNIEYIVLRNGLKIYVGGNIMPADLSMIAEIWHNKFYNPAGFEIKDNFTVFDIGGNSGVFSLYASNAAKNGKVYVFEPFLSLADKIKKSIEANDIKNIVLVNKAVGGKNDVRDLFVSDVHNGCHSLYDREETSKKMSVSVVTLPEYCSENNINYIDFLKLDCEGAEYEIITSDSISFLGNHVGLISMEYHDNLNNNHHHDEIAKILTQGGFTVDLASGYLYARNKNYSKN